jgi:hypothetical protein
MTLRSLTDWCLQVGGDPNTLRLWLKTARISCCVHPADARLKGLTLDQLSQGARLHDRRQPALADSIRSLSLSSPAPSHNVADLRHHLTVLQAQVSTLQAQMTELALALLLPWGLLCQLTPPTPAAASALSLPCSRHIVGLPRLPPHLTRSHPGPPRALPLSEIRPDGTAVISSPTESVLPLLPDSPAWFDWLASLTSFLFQG